MEVTFYILGSECLEWKIRFKVAVGVAKGLQYLHHDCPRRIIHRDIKASNILLNENNEAEVLCMSLQYKIVNLIFVFVGKGKQLFLL